MYCWALCRQLPITNLDSAHVCSLSALLISLLQRYYSGTVSLLPHRLAMMASSGTVVEGPQSYVPGTVHLIDLEHTMQAKHAQGGQRDILLVPTPSSDADDPLNWSPRRKMLSTICMCVYTLMVGIASAAIYSVLEPISAATGLTLGDLNAGTGYMFLFFGWGCLFWQPLALQYGKRPVYLFSILATMLIQIWAPYTKSNGQWAMDCK